MVEHGLDVDGDGATTYNVKHTRIKYNVKGLILALYLMRVVLCLLLQKLLPILNAHLNLRK
jgi:hypothetical protein